MVRASRAFFEAGGFGAQLAGVTAEVSRALADCPDIGERHVLNAGCGEGAYLRLRPTELAAYWDSEDGADHIKKWYSTDKLAKYFALGPQYPPQMWTVVKPGISLLLSSLNERI